MPKVIVDKSQDKTVDKSQDKNEVIIDESVTLCHPTSQLHLVILRSKTPLH